MPKRRVEIADKTHRCRLCGEEIEESKALGHLLVAHGLPATDRKQKRKRARAALSQIHRRLEEMGFSESDAHRIVRAVGEELRKAGMT